MSKSALVDTNILLRFLTGEPPTLAERARDLIQQADIGKLQLEIPSVIVAETVYTLDSFYEMPKGEVCEQLLVFFRSRGVALQEPEIILNALERYRDLTVHFADAYLAASASVKKLAVYSFDQDFAKFKDLDWKQ